jgi:hypothetical protein
MTPGRRAALLLGVPIVFLIFAANGYSLVSNIGTGSYPVRATIRLPDGKLTMGLGGGDATLRGSEALSAMAQVTGTVDYHLARPSLRLTAGDISLDCPGVDTGNCSLDATIHVPARTALTVATGGGDLSATGLAGDATLSTDGGNLTVAGATGDLTLATGGGDVSASNVSGHVLAISANGGNIGGTAVAAPIVTATSSGGDVTLTLTTIPRNLQVNTDGGNVTIVVPPGSYSVTTNTDGGNLTHTIRSTVRATNVINVSSGGGDINLSESL